MFLGLVEALPVNTFWKIKCTVHKFPVDVEEAVNDKLKSRIFIAECNNDGLLLTRRVELPMYSALRGNGTLALAKRRERLGRYSINIHKIEPSIKLTFTSVPSPT